MTVEQRTVGELAVSNGAVANDLVMVVVNANTANANNRRITITNFFGNLTVNVAGSFNLTTTGGSTTNTLVINYANTPASNVAVPSVARHMWWDESYLYVVANTSSNTIKRVALSNF